MIRAHALGVVASMALSVAGCGFHWQPAFDEPFEAAALGTVAIAPVEEALTFARTGPPGDLRVLLVSRYEEGRVDGIDLGRALGREVRDPIDAFHAVGYDALALLHASAAEEARTSVAAGELVIPVDLRAEHVAAGTNFPEHADDAGVEDGPFLFAKLVEPSGPRDPVPAGTGLLDYEVELAWVTLAPLADGAEPGAMGVILCNDFTDRELLLRHVDPFNVASGDGFTTGKSAPGYLPVGDLFVVPRDFRAFAAATELRLGVNGRLRQRAPASAMAWDFDEILRQTWARRGHTWEHRDTRVALPGADGVIPARTMLLAGTPHGTVFDGVRRGQMARGVLAWLLGGWSEPVAAHVVGVYIRDARQAGIYLQPGDVVSIHADGLGVLQNRVEP